MRKPLHCYCGAGVFFIFWVYFRDTFYILLQLAGIV
nr:MAG TPA: hypothetical protein [Caudoviricetes sp.]